MAEQRSDCPINLTVELLGDKWSILVVRDIALGERRHFRELLTQSEEGIAANMLSDRLKMLMAKGIITRRPDPSHKQKKIYSLTEKGIELFPIIAQMAIWGRKHTKVSKENDALARLLEDGGPAFWAKLMKRLRADHLQVPDLS